jgi:hypothetical protein
VNTEERQLSEMLHRVTPEPPRRVTVEDVAFRLANQAGRRREPRAWRAPGRSSSGWGRAWAPALAAASVFVVAGASAGIAVGLTSHHGPSSPAGNTLTTSSAPVSAVSSPPVPVQGPTSREPTWPPERVANGMWGAELINRDTLAQDSLVGGGNSLYAIVSGYLNRIDPKTGNVLDSTQYSAPVTNPPVVLGNTVWVVWSYGGDVVLHGYNGTTLAQVASVTVPVSGPLSSTAQGVLTAGPDGNLYVAAGGSVAVVNPSSRQVIRTITVPAGQASSVAVSPDGSKLYVSTAPSIPSIPSTPSSSFELLTYDPVTGAQLGSSAGTDLTSAGGNLVATSGGVWGTTGVAMTEWVWFAPNADLTRMVRVSQGAGAGLDSVPSFSGGTVWIGGSHTLVCADPATGRARASATIPTDGGVVEYFGSVTVTGGRAYAYYQNQRAQQAGVVTLTPPAACSG